MTNRLEIIAYPDAVIIPRMGEYDVPGLYDKNGCYVAYSGKRLYNSEEYLYNSNRLAVGGIILSDNRRILYLGDLRLHYGHFLIDEASRLWTVMNGLPNNCDGIAVFTPDNHPVTEFYKAFLNALGVQQDKIILVDKPIRFREVLFGQPSYVVGKYIDELYKETFERLSANLLSNHQYTGLKRLYLSRSSLRKGIRKEFGEVYLEKILKRYGFAILHPEKMCLEDQIMAYANAEIMMTTNGTLSHNVLFCDRNVNLIIVNRFYQPNGNIHQNEINKFLKQPVTVVAASPKSANHSISLIDMNKNLRDVLNSISGDKKKLTCIEVFPRRIAEWIKYLILLVLYSIKEKIIKKNKL